jgi:hypothetical protein
MVVMTINKTLLILSIIFLNLSCASHKLEGDYSFKLYFGDSKPFTDDLSITVGKDDKLKGHMHVPNDFDADLENITIQHFSKKLKLSFIIPLPKKYHKSFGQKLFYELYFLKRNSHTKGYNEQFVGFITHRKNDNSPTYVGSVVGFRKKD